MAYDDNNIFARILRGEIPAVKIYEDEHVLTALVRATGQIAKAAGVVDSGYRLILNHGPHSHQEVPHLHIHILGGRPMGPLLRTN